MRSSTPPSREIMLLLSLLCSAATALSTTQLINAQSWQQAADQLQHDISQQDDDTVRALQRTCLGECRVKLHQDAAALDAFAGLLGNDASLGAAVLGQGRCLARLGHKGFHGGKFQGTVICYLLLWDSEYY